MQARKHSLGVRALVAAFVLGTCAAAIAADAVSVGNAWVRATVPGQSVAGAYMDITAQASAALVAAESPVADKVELHTMSMDGGMMRMRALERLVLPAKRTVSLTPGGHHLMLIGIKHQLKPGERVPLTLTVRDQRGVKSTLQVDAEVRAVAGAKVEHKQHR